MKERIWKTRILKTGVRLSALVLLQLCSCLPTSPLQCSCSSNRCDNSQASISCGKKLRG